MDAVVLCGGFGTRIEPLGLFFPKALLPIKGRPILDYIIDQLDKTQEVERIIVSTNKKFKDQFDFYIRAKKALGLKKELVLIVEPSASNNEKFGSVRGLVYAIKEAKVSSDLLVIFGDNFYDFELEMLFGSFKEKRRITVALYDINSIEEARKYGVVKLDQGKIVELDEKPESPKSTLVSTGIYLFPKEKLALFDTYLNGKDVKDAFGNFVRWCLERDEVYGVSFHGGYGRWYDIGSLETYKKVYDMENSGA